MPAPGTTRTRTILVTEPERRQAAAVLAAGGTGVVDRWVAHDGGVAVPVPAMLGALLTQVLASVAAGETFSVGTLHGDVPRDLAADVVELHAARTRRDRAVDAALRALTDPPAD